MSIRWNRICIQGCRVRYGYCAAQKYSVPPAPLQPVDRLFNSALIQRFRIRDEIIASVTAVLPFCDSGGMAVAFMTIVIGKNRLGPDRKEGVMEEVIDMLVVGMIVIFMCVVG